MISCGFGSTQYFLLPSHQATWNTFCILQRPTHTFLLRAGLGKSIGLIGLITLTIHCVITKPDNFFLRKNFFSTDRPWIFPKSYMKHEYFFLRLINLNNVINPINPIDLPSSVRAIPFKRVVEGEFKNLKNHCISMYPSWQFRMQNGGFLGNGLTLSDRRCLQWIAR